MESTTIIIERTPRTLRIGNMPVEVEELDVRLPFTRKPSSLRDVGGQQHAKVYVTETLDLSQSEFDSFASSLYASHRWLRGKGGRSVDGHFCSEVVAPGRPFLYVNPEGSNYARYVARLG